jgi:glycosyltransferase involved in cell wall biosynthesis
LTRSREEETDPVRVSIVVPTHRRPGLLARCLAALLRQDLGASAFEVIVADNAADAETQALVQRLASAAGPPLRYVPAGGGRGPAFARNVGWRAAVGEIIAFTDDDTAPDIGWLRAGLAALASADAAWGRICVPLPQPPTDYERNEAGLETAEFATANAFCRRPVLAAVDGFDERFTAAWREDADLFFTLLEKGFRVVPAPEAVVVHPVRPGRWGISLSQQRKSRFNALLYKKHPALYRQRIQPRPPWHYYAAGGAFVTALAGAAAGLPGLVFVGSGLWLALTARFCARRLRGTSHAPAHVAEMALTSALIPLLSVYWRLRGALHFRVFFL